MVWRDEKNCIFVESTHIYLSMEKRIIECVPNFSEGRNLEVIKNITDAIESVEGVKLLGKLLDEVL